MQPVIGMMDLAYVTLKLSPHRVEHFGSHHLRTGHRSNRLVLTAVDAEAMEDRCAIYEKRQHPSR